LLNDMTLPESTHPDILYGPPQPEFVNEEVLADVFEATARRMPEQLALISGGKSVSYRELDRLADVTASRLIQAGVGPGHFVGRGCHAVSICW
jgi:non-ribosomal peptide synthetase component F